MSTQPTDGDQIRASALHDPTVLPADLPVPKDDGAAAHLVGAAIPRMPLLSTAGRWVNLGALPRRTVVFFYPRTGVPGQAPGLGFGGEEWDSIPGARGCTPQSCGFRDLYAEFVALGVDVLGISTSSSEHQREFVSRMHIPFEMLSDADLTLTRAMRLPVFRFPVESGGLSVLIHRMAWLVAPMVRPWDGPPRVTKVWYPVFPPNENAQRVLEWLRAEEPGRTGDIAASTASTVSTKLSAARSSGAARVDAPVRLEYKLPERGTGVGGVRAASRPREDPPEVRAATNDDLEFVRGELRKHWLGTTIWSRDKRFEADALPAFVAWRGGERVGLLTYALEAGELEIITVSSCAEDAGVGSALMASAESTARAAACRRVFLTTTNDNLRALRFYQRRGYCLVAVLRNMMDRYRERQPEIPREGKNGIPLRDEIELELRL